MELQMKRIEMFYTQISISVCRLRKEKGMSREELAKKSGIELLCLENIEKANVEYDYSINVLFSISKALNANMCEIFRF